jgi:hypothetical protein
MIPREKVEEVCLGMKESLCDAAPEIFPEARG